MSLTEIKAALLEAVCGEPGPLHLSRSFCRARAEAPDRSWSDLLDAILAPSTAASADNRAEALREREIGVTTVLDPDYPRQLAAIADPPLVLFTRGSLRNLYRPAIAIVGSRKPTDYGRGVAAELAGGLARLGFAVTSGLARGIDGRAHAAALEVGGHTTAALGTGLDRIYPPEHRRLAESILDRGGTLVSEFPPGTPPKPFHFPVRNRVISGLSQVVIVVEAQTRSGSLSTARHALEQGRELFAVPGSIHQPNAQGTNGLIARGEARLLTGVADVLDELQPLLGRAAEQREKLNATITDPLARAVWERLDTYEATPFDILVTELDMAPGTLRAKLTELEADNHIEARPGLTYLRNPLR